MRRLNLAQRIWLSFFLLVFVVGLFVVIIYPLSIRETLTDESYEMIEEQQQRILKGPTSPKEELPQSDLNFIERREAVRSVGHLLLGNQSYILEGDYVPRDVERTIWERAVTQKDRKERYELNYGGASLFYVIQKIELNGNAAFLVSYMWDTYRNQLVQQLWSRLIWIFAFGILISVIPAAWLSGYLRKPLKALGERFEQIGNRNWKESFRWAEDQDFQKLSVQFERMRQNLIRNDESQKRFIQHASHELKTPIMTIKSYAQSVKDGVLPEKDLDGMMDIIISQSDRMEERVKDMLYFSKLDTLSDTQPEKSVIRFGQIAEEVVDRFWYQRDDLDIRISGEAVTFRGDPDQWEVVLENLIQNATRYAHTYISLSAENIDHTTVITVKNDGEKVADEDLERIFKPFQKSHKGQFGLGLAIVKRIVELHNGTVELLNDTDGVMIKIVL